MLILIVLLPIILVLDYVVCAPAKPSCVPVAIVSGL